MASVHWRSCWISVQCLIPLTATSCSNVRLATIGFLLNWFTFCCKVGTFSVHISSSFSSSASILYGVPQRFQFELFYFLFYVLTLVFFLPLLSWWYSFLPAYETWQNLFWILVNYLNYGWQIDSFSKVHNSPSRKIGVIPDLSLNFRKQTCGKYIYMWKYTKPYWLVHHCICNSCRGIRIILIEIGLLKQDTPGLEQGPAMADTQQRVLGMKSWSAPAADTIHTYWL